MAERLTAVHTRGPVPLALRWAVTTAAALPSAHGPRFPSDREPLRIRRGARPSGCGEARLGRRLDPPESASRPRKTAAEHSDSLPDSGRGPDCHATRKDGTIRATLRPRLLSSSA